VVIRRSIRPWLVDAASSVSDDVSRKPRQLKINFPLYSTNRNPAAILEQWSSCGNFICSANLFQLAFIGKIGRQCLYVAPRSVDLRADLEVVEELCMDVGLYWCPVSIFEYLEFQVLKPFWIYFLNLIYFCFCREFCACRLWLFFVSSYLSLMLAVRGGLSSSETAASSPLTHACHSIKPFPTTEQPRKPYNNHSRHCHHLNSAHLPSIDKVLLIPEPHSCWILLVRDQVLAYCQLIISLSFVF